MFTRWSEGRDRPNVLCIMADQWHHDCLGLRGHPDVRTPNLDALAAEGMPFAQAYAQSPLCQPSRVCFLTGSHCATHRAFGNAPGRIDRRLPLMTRTFRQAGYQTAVTGKMHLDVMPPDWGVDFVSSTLRGENWRVCGGGRAYSDDIQARGYPHPNDQTHGWVPNRVPPSSANPEDPVAVQCSGRSDIPEEDSIERWAADEAIRFLGEERDRHKPFWLWLSFDRPHGPHTVPLSWDGRHTPESIHLGAFPDAESFLSKHRSFLRDFQKNEEFTQERYLRQILASYFNLIELIDHEIGRVVDHLREEVLYDDTVVLFCADHGDRAGVLRLNNKPGCTTDQINHVPLILKPAGGVSGSVAGQAVGSTVRLIDLYPTLCDLCGLPCPETVDGRSFAGVFRGDGLKERTAVSDGLIERAVIRDGWALYTYWRRHDTDELYHLADDPEERSNLGADPAYREKRRELKWHLIREMSQPFTAADTRQIDGLILAEEVPRGMWQGPRGMRKDPEDPWTFTSFAGMWLVCGQEHQLFLRLDGKKPVAFRTAERDRLDDVFATALFQEEHYEAYLDALLDYLVETVRPVSASNHHVPPENLACPSDEEVRAFLRSRPESPGHAPAP